MGAAWARHAMCASAFTDITSRHHRGLTNLAESAKFCATSWPRGDDKGYLPNNLRILCIKLLYPVTPSPDIPGL